MMALSSEFIGMHAEITKSSNKNLVGIVGKIIDETKSTFVIKANNGTKVIAKDHNTWKFQNDQVINGTLISKRPEDRIKVKA